MKPIIILEPGIMSDANIKTLRDNGLCVVTAKKADAVKFIDPIPACSSRTEMEQAAIKLSRLLLSHRWGDYSQSNLLGPSDFASIYVKILTEGTELDAQFSYAKNQAYQHAKLEELRKIAREEARAEKQKKGVVISDINKPEMKP